MQTTYEPTTDWLATGKGWLLVAAMLIVTGLISYGGSRLMTRWSWYLIEAEYHQSHPQSK